MITHDQRLTPHTENAFVDGNLRLIRMARDLRQCTSPEEAITRVMEYVQRETACDAVAALHDDSFVTSVNIDVCPFARCDEPDHLHLHEGPGPQALEDGDPIRIDDTSKDRRWTQWSERVGAQGFRSVLSIGLRTEKHMFASLTMFNREAGGFSVHDVGVATLLTHNAVLALRAAHTQRRLDTFLATENLIRAAQGILMSRFHLDAARAFNKLRRYSQTTNTKVPLVAQAIVDVRKNHGAALVASDAGGADRLIKQTIQSLAYQAATNAHQADQDDTDSHWDDAPVPA